MDVKDDTELLGEYVVDRSEGAFTELVHRHVGMVYAAALRQVGGDVHLAQDVAQLVFIDLSRKSARLTRHTSLTGWLYTSVRYAAATARRANQRRQRREHEAQAMNESLHQQPSAAHWEMLQPVLDEALHALGEADRHAILLRFLEGKTLAEVGRGLGLNENAARKRVDRALQKLRHFFGRRGIAISAIVLAETLSSKAIVAVPPSLASAVTTVSIKATPITFPLLKLMAITKTQLGAASVAAAMATTIIFQSQSNHRLRQEAVALRQQTARMDDLRAENERLAKTQSDASRPLGQDPSRELARLRAEVGRLRTQLAEASKAGPQKMESAPQAQPDANAAYQEKQLAILRMHNAKQLMLAFHQYAGDQQEHFPTNFGQIASYLDDTMTNDFEIVYQGARNEITNARNTIVIRETQAQPTTSGGWSRAYGFADGHSEIHVVADGNFADWEQQHVQSPPGQ
jgi:RNA polymerase sigma factor (sigma-70 family)